MGGSSGKPGGWRLFQPLTCPGNRSLDRTRAPQLPEFRQEKAARRPESSFFPELFPRTGSRRIERFEGRHRKLPDGDYRAIHDHTCRPGPTGA